MTDRYDALLVRSYVDRDGNEKTAWTKIGTAFPYREGDGFMLKLDALPTGQINRDTGDLEIVVHLRPPLPKDNEYGGRQQGAQRGGGRGGYQGARGGVTRAGGARRPAQQGGGGYQNELDDEIPF